MTKEKQAREEMRVGWSRRGRTTNWGERKEGAARSSCTCRGLFLSLEGNIMSLYLSVSKYLRGKVPHLLILTPIEHNLLLPPASLLAQVADVDEVDPKVSVQLFTPMWLPTAKFLAIHFTCFEKARKLHIQKLYQKYFKRLQTEATNFKEIPALGSLYTEKLPRSC